ncbi:MAG: response regulator [Prevotellaceae bacterium]|nr:response regulator [Prevotellaceae bacterium]MDO4932436.1 response regulator [Prevotellaceae bacterium]
MNTQINPDVDQSQINVLIVDDIPLNVLLIQKMLGRFKFNIMTANDGQAALDMVEEKPVDLMLLDLMMPGVGGYEVIEQIRGSEKHSQLPIVILSALNSSEEVKKGLDLGANAFITKPIIMERLLSCVASMVNMIWENRQK